MTKNNNLVTVFVMVYNNAQYLQGTLESILFQTYSNIEIIISDDCSNKECDVLNKTIKKYRNYSNIFININKKNLGTVKHINQIIKNSKGDILCPLSCGDIFYDDNVVQKIVDYFSTHEELICTAKSEIIKGNDKHFVLPNIFDQRLFKNRPKLISRMCRGNIIYGACTYSRREIYSKYGFYDEKYTLLEDWPYYLKLLCEGVPFGFLDEITIKYQLGGVSTSKKTNSKLREDNIKMHIEIWNNYASFVKFWGKRIVKYRYLKGTASNKIGLFFVKITHIDVAIFLTIRNLYNIRKE